MPLTRVYLAARPPPTSTPCAGGGAVGPAPRPAHAVTASPRATGPDDRRGGARAHRVARGGRGGRRLERRGPARAASSGPPTSTPRPWCTRRVPTSRRGSRSRHPLERRRFVSFHVDEEPGATDVADLLWYDVTELDDVRALVAGS